MRLSVLDASYCQFNSLLEGTDVHFVRGLIREDMLIDNHKFGWLTCALIGLRVIYNEKVKIGWKFIVNFQCNW